MVSPSIQKSHSMSKRWFSIHHHQQCGLDNKHVRDQFWYRCEPCRGCSGGQRLREGDTGPWWRFDLVCDNPQSQRDQSFFLTNRTGAPKDEQVGYMKPRDRCLSKNSHKAQSLDWERE